MLQIENYLYASNLGDAYQTLHSTPGSVVLGGCGYLRLGTRKISTAIDLSRLELDYIRETGDTIEIGAMTSLRTIETHPVISTLCNGVLSSSVKDIVGIQLRNCVTLGGTVAGRYPFSDPITALLALDTHLKFHHHGSISLTEYMEGKGLKDILEKIVIHKENSRAAFTSVRKSATDYAVLNVAVSVGSANTDTCRIIVGSRPGRAIRALDAAKYIKENGLDETTASKAATIATQELQFGDNPRGSGDYRKAICPVLIKRALLEVMHAA